MNLSVSDLTEWGPIVGGLRQQSNQTTLMLTVIIPALLISHVSITIIIHVQCRATLQAIGLYLEAFQKIADAATNSKGLLLHFIPDASLFVCLKCVCVFDCSFFIFYLQEQPKILVPLSREYAYVSEQLKAELNHLLGKYKF